MKSIAVEKISSLNKDFDIFFDSPEYDPSLIEAGIYPPLVVSGGMLVWGFSVLRKAAEKGIKELNCVEKSGSIQQLLYLALKLENRLGNYSWEEKASILLFMQSNSIEASDDILSLVQAGGSFVKSTEKYLSLSSALKKYVSDSEIDLKTAYKLKNLSDEIFLMVFNNTGLSFASKRLILTYLLEISKRDGLGEKELAAFTEKIFSNEDPLSDIIKCRYPYLENLKSKMDNFKNNYIKKTGIVLKEPDYFEGNSFKVSFSFKSEKQLERIISNLEKIKEKSSELFDLL